LQPSDHLRNAPDPIILDNLQQPFLVTIAHKTHMGEFFGLCQAPCRPSNCEQIKKIFSRSALSDSFFACTGERRIMPLSTPNFQKKE